MFRVSWTRFQLNKSEGKSSSLPSCYWIGHESNKKLQIVLNETNLENTFLKELISLAELVFSFVVYLNLVRLVTDSYWLLTDKAQRSLSRRLVQRTLLHWDWSWKAKMCFKILGATALRYLCKTYKISNRVWTVCWFIITNPPTPSRSINLGQIK